MRPPECRLAGIRGGAWAICSPLSDGPDVHGTASGVVLGRTCAGHRRGPEVSYGLVVLMSRPAHPASDRLRTFEALVTGFGRLVAHAVRRVAGAGAANDVEDIQ